jgi:UDP-2-acetamido-2-deoxy-ribo-hexuluronate aminotransferase
MNIDFANLNRQYLRYKDEIDRAIQGVIESSAFIMGPDIYALEEELQTYTGAKHAIACSSGTDALLLSMMALGIQPGDEVITTPFTFVATAETIAFLGAIPVFADIDEETYNIDATKIEERITSKTKAIMPVSLYGQPADMDEINAIAKNYRLKVIEDAAQSFGAEYKGKKSCNLSDIGCTSFFPAKPLGCFGDGGAVFTDDDTLAEKIRSLRIHGQTARYHHKYIGMGGRMDTIQAAILRVKLRHYEDDLKKRQEVARVYSQKITVPGIQFDRTSAWAQFSVRMKNRDEVQAILKEKGVPTAVHYPKPLHLQECFGYLGHKQGEFPIAEKISNEIISLPMNADISSDELQHIMDSISGL